MNLFAVKGSDSAGRSLREGTEIICLLYFILRHPRDSSETGQGKTTKSSYDSISGLVLITENRKLKFEKKFKKENLLSVRNHTRRERRTIVSSPSDEHDPKNKNPNQKFISGLEKASKYVSALRKQCLTRAWGPVSPF